MTALYIVIAGACCLVAGFLIGFFLKPQKKAAEGSGSMPEKESGQLESDLEKKEEEAAALKSSLEDLRSKKEDLARENAALSEKCSALEERVADLKDDIAKSEADFKEHLKSQKEEREAAEERLRSSIKEEFEKSRQTQRMPRTDRQKMDKSALTGKSKSCRIWNLSRRTSPPCAKSWETLKRGGRAKSESLRRA